MFCLRELCYLLLLLSLISCGQDGNHSNNRSVISLNGAWTLTDLDSLQQYSAQVPGTVHTDLLMNHAIEDPYYGYQEEKLKYLEEKNWRYSRTFELDSDLLNSPHLELLCKGLDTYSKLYINDALVGQSSNMFRPWKFEIKPFVKIGKNKIRIEFTSPFKAKKAAVDSLDYVLPADNEFGERKYSPFCRKAAYHFGWDWAPRFVSSGIYLDIEVRATQSIELLDYAVHTMELTQEKALMVLKTVIRADSDSEVQCSLGDHFKSQKFLLEGVHQYLDTFEIHHPKLWWPNGNGEAYLYAADLILSSSEFQVFDQKIHFGIRTVELINEPDSIGTSFYFKLNGQAIFAKGANYIPQDIFLPRVKDEDYRKLLGLAKEAGMNMIRVWGGGIYEKDLFYHLCDSLGLMVWQDYMFAGTMYPVDDPFLKEVKEEVLYQSQRLSKHPSVVVWCGNNEIEVAWHNWGWQEKYGYEEALQEELWDAYVRMFHDSIPTWLRNINPYIPYTPTSPLSNWGRAENFNHSSMHYWGVWHGREDFSSYSDNVGRFMVEYGMQSYPDASLLLEYMDSNQLHLDSLALKSRQKSYIGNGEILKHIEQYFESPSNVQEFILRSQDMQAMALDSAIHHHMAKQGHCMGSLLWQLNDCWPGPSWSIIDYQRKPKKAYWVVKERFEEH